MIADEPVYPSGRSELPGYENSLPYYEGITARAHFAGLAMQGLCASMREDELEEQETSLGKKSRQFAIAACAYADALIAELNKPRP